MTTAARNKGSRGAFGRTLRAELDAQGCSIRELARRIAPSEDKVENTRRLLQQYVAGEVAMPREETRERIAEALAIDPSVFAATTEQQAERERLSAALEPLVDILLELATEARR